MITYSEPQEGILMTPLPLKHEESGPYARLASRPNPQGFLIAFMPALGAWLQHAEKRKGADLSVSEVVRLRDAAPAIALRPAQVQALREDRGYEDVDPLRVYESWREFKSEPKSGDLLP
jgi:hypothetical protein